MRRLIPALDLITPMRLTLPHMHPEFQKAILKAARAERLVGEDLIQSLWGGYGRLLRIHLKGGPQESVVVKHVRFPRSSKSSDLSHQRKLKSYEVETAWYQIWSQRCGEACRLPQCLREVTEGDDVLMILEDLDLAGFDGRRYRVTDEELGLGLSWLANFHATFMGERPKKLWKTGTYWHLATRPDELKVLKDEALRRSASAIDRALKNAPFQTFVHGDAKLANFCFHRDGNQVAAVDFQYVGGGCGMKDVAYYIGSCLPDEACEQRESELLDAYFASLTQALKTNGQDQAAGNIESAWRPLYRVAWADFHRFLKGWSSESWEPDSYSERVTREVVRALS